MFKIVQITISLSICFQILLNDLYVSEWFPMEIKLSVSIIEIGVLFEKKNKYEVL